MGMGMRFRVTILLIIFVSFISYGQDSTAVNYTNKHPRKINPKTSKLVIRYDDGSKKSVSRITIFNSSRIKRWDEDGRITTKQVAYKAMVTHPKRFKAWKYTYHDKGKVKTKAFIKVSGRLLVNAWTKTYSSKGKLVQLESEYH